MTPNNSGASGRIPEPQGCRASLRSEGDTTRTEGRKVVAGPEGEAGKVTADWRSRAKCLGSDPELWFPLGNSPATMKQIEQAKAVCDGCPVIEQCAEFARDTQAEYGIYGGRDEFERNGKRRQPKAPNPTRTMDPGRLEAVRQLVRLGHPETEIAAILRTTARTIARYKQRLREAS